MTLLEIFGWSGACAFALSSFPQAYLSWRQKHSNGLGWGLLSMWLYGELVTLAYVCLTNPDIILIANYVLNLVGLAVILKYKIWPEGRF